MAAGASGTLRNEPGGTWGLLLSGSIGKGHDSVAESCAAALASTGVPSRTLDCMAMLGGPGSKLGMAVFRQLIERPTVYDGFHFSHLRTGTRLPRAMQRASDRRLMPRLRQELDRGLGDGPRPVDRAFLLPVFPTGVSAATALKHEVPEVRVVTVCTDACAHRMWVHPGVDLYVVCSMLAANTVQRYDPDAAIAVVPPPVRPVFYEAPDRRTARAALGIDEGAPCVLLMSGGWGRGPLAETAQALASEGYEVLAVAGMNDSLHKRLQALAGRDPRVHPFGLTDRVPTLMAAADTVVTSPGQTCHEARVVGRWLVVLDVVPGHGRENALHEIESGGALACSADPSSVVGAVGVMFRDRPAVVPWPANTAEEWGKHFLAGLEEAGIELAH